ncbi:hypothetical protein LguiB_018160 [Lonicera macranthoides]
MSHSLSDDALSHVFGKDARDRTRGVEIRNSPVHDPLLDQMPRDGSSATLGTSSSSNMNRSLLDGVSCEINGFTGKVIGKGMIDATPEKCCIYRPD